MISGEERRLERSLRLGSGEEPGDKGAEHTKTRWIILKVENNLKKRVNFVEIQNQKRKGTTGHGGDRKPGWVRRYHTLSLTERIFLWELFLTFHLFFFLKLCFMISDISFHQGSISYKTSEGSLSLWFSSRIQLKTQKPIRQML